MVASGANKAHKASSVTFRYSRHFNAVATVVYQDNKPFINVSQFCQGMGKNLKWRRLLDGEVSQMFGVKTKRESGRFKLSNYNYYKANVLKIGGALYFTPSMLSKCLGLVSKHAHEDHLEVVISLSTWLKSPELAKQLKTASGFKSAMAFADIKLKPHTFEPGEWGIYRGAAFKMPPKVAPWDIDYSARFRAANGIVTTKRRKTKLKSKA